MTHSIDTTAPNRNILTLALIVVLGALAQFVAFAAYQPDASDWLIGLTTEDSAVEYLQAIAYLAAAIISFIAIRTSGFTWMRLAFGLGCLVLLGEEISWGQRLFDFSVPSVEAVNKQGEFNLHNLNIFSGHGFREARDFESFVTALTTSTNFFQLAFLTFFLLVPVALFIRRAPRFLTWLGYVRPGAAFLIPLWSLIAVSYALVQQTDSAEHIQILIELREVVFAGAFFAYARLLAHPSEAP